MSNITSLRKAFPGTSWKICFAEALMQLQPAMNPDAADEASDEAFALFEHLSPPAAAAAWVHAGRHLAADASPAAPQGHEAGTRAATF